MRRLTLVQLVLKIGVEDQGRFYYRTLQKAFKGRGALAPIGTNWISVSLGELQQYLSRISTLCCEPSLQDLPNMNQVKKYFRHSIFLYCDLRIGFSKSNSAGWLPGNNK